MCGCRMHDVKQAADAVEDGEVATEERSLAEESASRALSLFNAIRMTSDLGNNPHGAAHLKFSVLSYYFFYLLVKTKQNKLRFRLRARIRNCCSPNHNQHKHTQGKTPQRSCHVNLLNNTDL